MVSKLAEPEITWKQYTVIKYLKKTSTLDKGKEKLLESLLLSEVDSENTEDYANNYKRSRQTRARINLSTENIKSNENKTKKQKITEITHSPKQIVTDSISQISASLSSETSNTKTKLKPKITEVKTLQEKIKLPVPPSKRPRTDSEVEKRSVIHAQYEPSPSTSTNHKENSHGSSKIQKRKEESANKLNFFETPDLHDQNSGINVQFEPSPSTSSSYKESNYGSSKYQEKKRDSEIHFDHMGSLYQQDQNSDAQFEPPLSTLANHDKNRRNSSKFPERKRESATKFDNCMASLDYQDRKTGLSYEELSLSKLNEIILLLRQLKIQPQYKLGSTNSSRSFFDSEKCPKLPISSQSELKQISEKLKRNSIKTKMIEDLASIGGRNVNNAIANICQKLFTNSLANEYTWPGRNKKKLSLDDTILTDIII